MPVASALTIMVVDDQRSMRSVVKESLRTIGCHRLTECENGEDALKALALRPVHLIISDLNMPKMDGLGLLRAVRADPALQQTGFIMLTSRGEVDLVKQAMQLGVNNYLTKPFTTATLKKKIESVFGPLT